MSDQVSGAPKGNLNYTKTSTNFTLEGILNDGTAFVGH
jgi:hypothetical protein